MDKIAENALRFQGAVKQVLTKRDIEVTGHNSDGSIKTQKEIDWFNNECLHEIRTLMTDYWVK